MATTTNFGWETPDDTDLVKDGALAMRTLGNAIDASLVDLKGGTTGQVLSKTSNTDMDFTWVTSDDANAIQNAIVDAKGDLITATAADTPSRIAVGNNGETLVADSSASTGLRWQGNFAAGKNKIINGDFNIWQRGTSFTNPSGVYTADRFSWETVGMTGSISRQAFTAGTAPVAGYEGTYFARLDITSGSQYGEFVQKIEDARNFAGQTVTFSLWAKLTSGNSGWQVNILQNFGTGGSPSSQVLVGQTAIVPTGSWQRFTFTVAVPSVSGKTFGTNNNSWLGVSLQKTSTAASQLDTWGWQLEAGNTATAFQTATGTLAGEFQACARYYYRTAGQGNYAPTGISGVGQSTTTANGFFLNPVAMRTNATAIEFSNIAFYDGTNVTALTNMTLDDAGITSQRVGMNAAAGLTQYRPGFAIRNNNAAGYVAFSAEL